MKNGCLIFLWRKLQGLFNTDTGRLELQLAPESYDCVFLQFHPFTQSKSVVIVLYCKAPRIFRIIFNVYEEEEGGY